ncbi:hypothetical protein [Pelagimonas varians]|uniref:hypothetical protein n=1 Tax=Pelagimonas varians TaxID=696760 RepID=UPI0014737CCA|nr:hypothetical protein [Pelagimonas varians]
MEAETCINAQMASGVGVPAGKHDEMVSLHVENPERAKSFLSMLPKLDRPPHD